MANTLLTNDIIAKAILASFYNNLCLAKTANIQYASEFSQGRGATLRIQKPVRYTVRTGVPLQVQDVNEQNASLVVANRAGVDIELTSKELALDIRDLTKSYLDPAMQRLANQVENTMISSALSAGYHTAGTAGSAVNSFTTFNQARAALIRVGVNPEYACLNVADSVSLQGALQNSFNTPLNTSISQKAMIGRLANVDVMESPFSMQMTNGAYVGTPLVNGASQTGASLITDGWTGSVTDLLLPGNKFTIDGVFSVNPVNQQSTGELQTFVVTGAVDSSGGDATISISPSITVSGPYQTVSNSPANDAAITVLGSASAVYNNNFMYSKDAFCLGFVKLEVPQGATYGKSMMDKQSPVSIRLVCDYDITNDKSIYRTDILYGVLANPEYFCVLLGQ